MLATLESLESSGSCVGQRRSVPAAVGEVDQRIHDLEIIKANLQAAVDAGCDDITLCATTDCCPIPFAELTIHERGGNA